MNYHIRQFAPEESDIYKTIRLEALQLEPGMFSNSYVLEAAFPDENWIRSLSDPDMARFGLYSDDELIGLTSIVINKEDKDEAYMTQSYIRKAHRGKGLSGILYEARIAWAKQHNVKRLHIGHRESNIASKAANQKFGFIYKYRESRNWPPDSVQEDMLFYELHL